MLLSTMTAGGDPIEVNRSQRSVQEYVKRFTESGAVGDLEVQFWTRRAARPGWTRIWRVK